MSGTEIAPSAVYCLRTPTRCAVLRWCAVLRYLPTGPLCDARAAFVELMGRYHSKLARYY
eukprot:1602441-Rhodomonas_salina.5